MLYEQFKKQQEHRVEKDFKFKITFSCEQHLYGKKLKRANENYNYLTPCTTKGTKSKPATDDDGILNELDDSSTRFKLGFQVYKVFGNTEYKRKIIGYDSKNRLYSIEYDKGDTEEFYHNEIDGHRSWSKDPQVKQYVSYSGHRNRTNNPQAKTCSSKVLNSKVSNSKVSTSKVSNSKVSTSKVSNSNKLVEAGRNNNNKREQLLWILSCRL